MIKEQLLNTIKQQLLILDGLVMQYYFADEKAREENIKPLNDEVYHACMLNQTVSLQHDTRTISFNLTTDADVHIHMEPGVIPLPVKAVTPETPGDE